MGYSNEELAHYIAAMPPELRCEIEEKEALSRFPPLVREHEELLKSSKELVEAIKKYHWPTSYAKLQQAVTVIERIVYD